MRQDANTRTSCVQGAGRPGGPYLRTNTSSGQCHKYSEEEIRPMKVSGRRLSNRATGPVAFVPEYSSRHVPTHGRSAAAPGKGISLSKNNRLAPTDARPSKPAKPCSRAG